MSLLIKGYSDDGISMDGDVNEEFSCFRLSDEDAEPAYLGCSDGTLLRVRYDEDGVWRFTRLRVGKATFSLHHGCEESGTDEVTLDGGAVPISWVLFGDQLARGAK